MHQRPSRPFPARFDGVCMGCAFEIEEGDRIVMWNGASYHDDTECCRGLRDEQELPTGRRIDRNTPNEDEIADPWR